MKKILIIVGVVVGILLIGLGVYLFIKPSSSNNKTPVAGGFGTPGNRQFGGSQEQTPATDIPPSESNLRQNIFKISDGPVAGATFVQTQNPTTTLARFVMQHDGHVYDFPMDVPGAVLRTISNTTIPGIIRVLWGASGTSEVAQYLDGSLLKTVYVAFSKNIGSVNNAQAQVIQFFPDNLIDIAVSPTGADVAYLLAQKNGADGYIAHIDATATAKLFTLPLKQLLLSWPAPTTLLVQTKSAENIFGAIFAVAVKNGVVAQLATGPGITAIANGDFTKLVYQTRSGAPTTLVHIFTTAQDYSLPTNPSPERCVWDPVASTSMYCAIPTNDVAGSFLDMWHKGATRQNATIIESNTRSMSTAGVATPGLTGGIKTDIAEIHASPDGRYLLYVTRGDHSLWGVRLK